MRRLRFIVTLRLAAALLPLLVTATTQAAVQQFNQGEFAPPPMLHDSTAPKQCTVTYLVEDIANNDTYAIRMQVAPSSTAVASEGRLPCPSIVPPRVGQRALDGCRERAADPKTCMFADMSRGFQSEPLIRNTSENASRCSSDLATDIGIACWKSGNLDVCNVACGSTSAEAMNSAKDRCEAKHLKGCRITGSMPVLAP